MTDSATGNDFLLTVITPTLDSAATISDTLLSISVVAGLLVQRGWHLEHHVIDGGSTDGTLELVQSYQRTNTFSRLTRDVKGGLYAAMNYGLSQASGHFTHILNADDVIWDTSLYASLVTKSQERGASYLLGSIVYFCRPSWLIRSCWPVDPLVPDRNRWKNALKRGLHYPHPGFISRTDLYQSQRFDERYNLSADYKLMQILLIGSDADAVICTSKEPIVAMAEGGVTGSWKSIISGYWQLRAINRELGIQAPAWRRYIHKILRRYLRKRIGCSV